MRWVLTNDIVVCDGPDEPATALSEMLQRRRLDINVQGGVMNVELPFTCARYRANVRVTDFFPDKLDNFACWRRHSEFDLLGNDGASTDEESDDDEGESEGEGRSPSQRIWEWRFALRLEDASAQSRGAKDAIWVMVNNLEAQLLLGLDACE